MTTSTATQFNPESFGWEEYGTTLYDMAAPGFVNMATDEGYAFEDVPICDWLNLIVEAIKDDVRICEKILNGKELVKPTQLKKQLHDNKTFIGLVSALGAGCSLERFYLMADGALKLKYCFKGIEHKRRQLKESCFSKTIESISCGYDEIYRNNYSRACGSNIELGLNLLDILLNQGAQFKCCDYCGKVFLPKRNTRRFCSDACRMKAQPSRTNKDLSEEATIRKRVYARLHHQDEVYAEMHFGVSEETAKAFAEEATAFRHRIKEGKATQAEYLAWLKEKDMENKGTTGRKPCK